MTIRNLDFLFKPKSVALIGASRRPGSVGAFIARNLSNSGFAGPIMPINPKYTDIEGMITYPDIRLAANCAGFGSDRDAAIRLFPG